MTKEVILGKDVQWKAFYCPCCREERYFAKSLQGKGWECTVCGHTGPCIRFEVPDLPPRELSPNARVHWAKKYEAAQGFRVLVAAQLAQCALLKLRRARVKLTFVVPDRRRRDLDNLLTGCKPLLDELVYRGVLEDDDWTKLALEMTVMYKKGKRAILVEVCPFEER